MASEGGRKMRAPRERVSPEYVQYAAGLFAASPGYSERAWAEQGAALEALLDTLLKAERQQMYPLLERFYSSGFLEALGAFFRDGGAPQHVRVSVLSSLTLLIQNSRGAALRTFLLSSAAGGEIALAAAHSGADELVAFAASYVRSFALEFGPATLRELHGRGGYPWIRGSLDLLALNDPTLGIAVQTEVLSLSGHLKRYQAAGDPCARALFDWMLACVYAPLCEKLWRDALSVAMELTARVPGGYRGAVPAAAAPQLRTLLERLGSAVSFLVDLCCFGVAPLPRVEADAACEAAARRVREARGGEGGLFPGPGARPAGRRPSGGAAGRERERERDRERDRERERERDRDRDREPDQRRRFFASRKREAPARPQAGEERGAGEPGGGSTAGPATGLAAGLTSVPTAGSAAGPGALPAPGFAAGPPPGLPEAFTAADLPAGLAPPITEPSPGARAYDFSATLCELVVSQFMEVALPHLLHALSSPLCGQGLPWTRAAAAGFLGPAEPRDLEVPRPGLTGPAVAHAAAGAPPCSFLLAEQGGQPRRLSRGVALLFLLFVLERAAGTRLGAILRDLVFADDLAGCQSFNELFLAKPVAACLDRFYSFPRPQERRTLCLPDPEPEAAGAPGLAGLPDLAAILPPSGVVRYLARKTALRQDSLLDPEEKRARGLPLPGGRGFRNAVKDAVYHAVNFWRGECVLVSATREGEPLDAVISRLLELRCRGEEGGAAGSPEAGPGPASAGAAGAAGAPGAPGADLDGVSAMGFVDLLSEPQGGNPAPQGQPGVSGAPSSLEPPGQPAQPAQPGRGLPASLPPLAPAAALGELERSLVASYCADFLRALRARPVQLSTAVYFSELLAASGLAADPRVSAALGSAVRRLRAAVSAQAEIARAEEAELRSDCTESEAAVRCKAVPAPQNVPAFSRRDRLNPLFFVTTVGEFADSGALLGLLGRLEAPQAAAPFTGPAAPSPGG